jgi:hypothetical protein
MNKGREKPDEALERGQSATWAKAFCWASNCQNGNIQGGLLDIRSRNAVLPGL